MRNTITITCMLVVVAVGLSAAQTPTPQPAVKNQANIDALKKKLDEKHAEIKRVTELRDQSQALLSEPEKPSVDTGGFELKPGLEGAQELFGLLLTCFGSPANCGINADRDPSSDPDTLEWRLRYIDDSNKQLTKLTLEYDKILSDFVLAGGTFAGGINQFNREEQPGPQSDEEKRLADYEKQLDEEYRALEHKRKEEAKNKTKNEPPPPPPPPPPISSIPQTPTWDIAASFGIGSSVLSLNEPGAVGTSSGGHTVRNTAIVGSAIALATFGITALPGDEGAATVAVPPVTPIGQTTVPPAAAPTPFVSLDSTYLNIPFVLQPGGCAAFNSQFTGNINVSGHSSDGSRVTARLIERLTREYLGQFRNGTFEGSGGGAFPSGSVWTGVFSFSLSGGSVRNAREVLNVGASATSPACTATYTQP